MIGTFIAMAGFALATSASPGPVNIVSAMSGAKFRARRTIPYVLGATIGFVSILAIAGAGLGPVFVSWPAVEKTLAVSGSIYMLYLAYKLAKASSIDVDGLENQAPPGIAAGIVAQYANPKAWIVAVSAISVYMPAGAGYTTMLVCFCLIFFALCFPSLLAWSIIGSAFSRKPAWVRRFNLSMAILLVASIVAFIAETFR